MARRPKYATDPATFNAELARIVKLRQELKSQKQDLDELISTLEAHSDLPSKVEDNLTALKQKSAELTTLLDTTQNYADSIQTYYTSWTETKQKIDTELVNAKKQNRVIKEYSAETEKLKETYEAELERSGSLLDEARTTLDIVSNSASASVFKTRSQDRRKARKWWSLAVFLAVVLFAGSVLFAVLVAIGEIKDQDSLSVWVLKLAIITPFAYTLYFVARQYTHERDLEEKYMFKALVSQTIRNNTKLLRDEFLTGDSVDKETEKMVVGFVIKSLEGVYKEPFTKSSVFSKLKLDPRKPAVEAETGQTDES